MDKEMRRIGLAARIVMQRGVRKGKVTAEQHQQFAKLMPGPDFRLALVVGLPEFLPEAPIQIERSFDGTIIRVLVDSFISLVQYAIDHADEIIELILALIIAFT